MRKAMLQKRAIQLGGMEKPAVATINAPSVMPGDVVFFEAVDPGRPPGPEMPPGSGQVHHVEICTASMKIVGQVDITGDPSRGEVGGAADAHVDASRRIRNIA